MLWGILHLLFERGREGLTGVITFKPAILHWAIIGLSLLMVGTILIYAFFENLGMHKSLKQKTASRGSFFLF